MHHAEVVFAIHHNHLRDLVVAHEFKDIHSQLVFIYLLRMAAHDVFCFQLGLVALPFNHPPQVAVGDDAGYLFSAVEHGGRTQAV